MIKIPKHYLGFTLIELLLVIFIVGVLTVLGLTYYQKQTLANKITKTSLQMQQILQAATAFYLDNNCWPNSAQNSNCAQCPPTAPDFSQYLPAGIDKNPFGDIDSFKYSFQPEPTFCKKFQVLSGTLPSDSIITRLIALLPSAGRSTISLNPNQVLAEIATPSVQPIPEPNYIIQHISISQNKLNDTNSASFIFNCPAGWIGAGIVLPYNLQTEDWRSTGGYCVMYTPTGPGSYPIKNFSVPIDCSGQNSVFCLYSLIFESRVLANRLGCDWINTGTGQMQFVEIGLCNNPNAGNQTMKNPLKF